MQVGTTWRLHQLEGQSVWELRGVPLPTCGIQSLFALKTHFLFLQFSNKVYFLHKIDNSMAILLKIAPVQLVLIQLCKSLDEKTYTKVFEKVDAFKMYQCRMSSWRSWLQPVEGGGGGVRVYVVTMAG